MEEKQKDVCDKTGAGYATRMEAQAATANQIEEMQPDLVAILGDEQYEVGRHEDPFTADSAEGEATDAWWKLLYAHRATLVLNGHDHVYSRFAPMNPAGEADPHHGIREFIVGTGGESC